MINTDLTFGSQLVAQFGGYYVIFKRYSLSGRNMSLALRVTASPNIQFAP